MHSNNSILNVNCIPRLYFLKYTQFTFIFYSLTKSICLRLFRICYHSFSVAPISLTAPAGGVSFVATNRKKNGTYTFRLYESIFWLQGVGFSYADRLPSIFFGCTDSMEIKTNWIKIMRLVFHFCFVRFHSLVEIKKNRMG